MKKGKTICIDFDGVLHDYSEGYKGKDVFGDVIHDADKATKVLKNNGWTIVIFTTRPKTEALESWLKEKHITYDYINENPNQPEDSNGGKVIADLYLDDRGMCFRGQWDEWLIGQIASFSPWQKKNTEALMERQYKQSEEWANENIFDVAKGAL